MFSGKLFTIVSAVLAVVVNGSPVGFEEGELQAVRSPRGAVDVGGCKIQVLTVLFPQGDYVGNVRYCTETDFEGDCTVTPAYEWGCANTPGSIKSFSHDWGMVCDGWKYVSPPTATETDILMHVHLRFCTIGAGTVVEVPFP